MRVFWFILIFLMTAGRAQAAVVNADNDSALFASDSSADPDPTPVPSVAADPRVPAKEPRLNQFDTRMDTSRKLRARKADTRSVSKASKDSGEEFEIDASVQSGTDSEETASEDDDQDDLVIN